MELTIAEELLLLALDEEKGSTGWTSTDAGLSGALLVDLGRLGALRLEGKLLVPAREVVPEHPLLARVHALIASSDKQRKASSWLSRLPTALKPLTGSVAQRLVEVGVLAEQRSRMLGLFGYTRYPEANPAPEAALRERLRQILTGVREPDDHDRLLFGLLVPLDLVADLVERPDRRGAKKRAKQIADGGVAGTAVQDAVTAEVMAAVLPAVTAATVAGTSQ